MFSLYIVSDDRTPAFAAVTKPLLPWIFVSTQFKQICALTYGVITLAILKKSFSDFFQKSLSAWWIRRDQLQLERILLGELFRTHAKLPNTQNPIEISPAKFCWATVNVFTPLHKQVYYNITFTQKQSRAPVIHESCKIYSICCLDVSATYRHLSESRRGRIHLSKIWVVLRPSFYS